MVDSNIIREAVSKPDKGERMECAVLCCIRPHSTHVNLLIAVNVVVFCFVDMLRLIAFQLLSEFSLRTMQCATCLVNQRART